MTLPSCPRQTRTWPHYWRTALSAWPLASLWSGEWDNRRFGRRGNVRYFLQVRQRHCQPRPHLPQWCSGGKRWSCDGWTILSSSPGNFIVTSQWRMEGYNDVTVRGPTDIMSSMLSGSWSICSVSCWPSSTWENSTKTSPRRILRLWESTDFFLLRLKLRNR